MNQSYFYVVWREGGESPTVRHESFKSAKKEAERLASTHQGKFFVLCSVGHAQRVETEWVDHDIFSSDSSWHQTSSTL